jgi:hypothetical protein
MSTTPPTTPTIPTPTTYLHIQADPNWQIVTGPSIGPAVPKIDITQQPETPAVPAQAARPAIPGGLLIDITGVVGKYADGVARSADYPVPPGTTGMVLTAVFEVDANSFLYTQAIEIGCKVTQASGITLNGQLQFGYAAYPDKMVLDLTSISGSGWAPTKVVLPKFAPDVIHTVVIAYKVEPTQISVLSVTIDGALYPTDPSMMPVPGKSLGWAKGKFQTNFQPNTNPKGGNWHWVLNEVTMVCS